MPVYLEALALQFYRGIGPEMQFISPFSELNFFIGANNSGKSTILNFINEHTLSKGGNLKAEHSNIDEYRGKETGNLTTGLGIRAEDLVRNVTKRAAKSVVKDQYFTSKIELIVNKISFEDYVWVKPRPSTNVSELLIPPDMKEFIGLLAPGEWSALRTTLYALYTDAIRVLYALYTAVSALQKINLASGAKNLHPAGNHFYQGETP